MAKASDFYFSTPKNFVPDKFNDIYVILIVPKKEYDEKGIADVNSSDYDDLVDLKVYDFLVDLDEGVFELNDINTKPEDLELRLKNIGFIYNPALDSELKSWIKEYKAKNDTYKIPPGKIWDKKSENQNTVKTKKKDKKELDEKVSDETEAD